MDNKNRIQTFVKNNQIGMVLIISLGLFVLTIVLNPKSFNVNAFGSILSLTSMLTIAAAGQTLVVIADGIDMSLGATMSMAALLTVGILAGRSDALLFLAALLAAVLVGGSIGFCNGLGSVKAGLPPMVVTLYISNVVTRLQYVITGGTPKFTSVPVAYKSFVTERLFQFLPVIFFFAATMYLLIFLLMNRTRYGQQIFLTGNNNRAAYLTGIRTTRLKMLNYTVAGVLGGLAGFIGSANSGYINCGTFDGMTIDTIVAVVIGGTLLSGGKGSYAGTAAGVLLLIVLSNGLTVLSVSPSMKNLIMGVILILLLAVYNRAKPVRQ